MKLFWKKKYFIFSFDSWVKNKKKKLVKLVEFKFDKLVESVIVVVKCVVFDDMLVSDVWDWDVSGLNVVALENVWVLWEVSNVDEYFVMSVVSVVFEDWVVL